MKASELRLRNYYNGDGIYYKINITDLQNLIDDPQDDFYQPIPLTEDILLKCGIELKFEELESGSRMSYWVKGAFDLEIGADGKICFEVYSHYIEVKYLHQLQNLYFALTGEELNINF